MAQTENVISEKYILFGNLSRN